MLGEIVDGPCRREAGNDMDGVAGLLYVGLEVWRWEVCFGGCGDLWESCWCYIVELGDGVGCKECQVGGVVGCELGML